MKLYKDYLEEEIRNNKKAEDEKKRKDIETRNKAEQMINEIDKALAEQGDRIRSCRRVEKW